MEAFKLQLFLIVLTFATKTKKYVIKNREKINHHKGDTESLDV